MRGALAHRSFSLHCLNLVVPAYVVPSHGLRSRVQGAPAIKTWNDGWTVVTEDGGRTAQFEHTVLITADGALPLTELLEETDASLAPS
jgi:hypothetical protein